MRVLYVTGSCLDNNTSANMSHSAYLEGLVENDASVDVVMASNSWGERDAKLRRIDGVHYYLYNSISFNDRVRLFAHRFFKSTEELRTDNSTASSISSDKVYTKSIGSVIRLYLKKCYDALLNREQIYPNNKKWLSTASKYKSKEIYDLVVSNSSPAASHKLVVILTNKQRIHYKRWIQIWEDPWCYDLYGGFSSKVNEEEHSLLKAGQEIYYVSPLTLLYQKGFFPDCSEKMKVIPLPFFVFSNDNVDNEENELSFGYFGDYYSHVRNLHPFYEALKESGMKGYIYGDSDHRFEGTGSIEVSGRVTLDVLDKIQNRTRVLVHLCNLRGGQIPGKIYHYSATRKPILFILDGTDEDKLIIRNYFAVYDRYVFCDNTKEDILTAMKSLEVNERSDSYRSVEEFSPKSIVERFLK